MFNVLVINAYKFDQQICLKTYFIDKNMRVGTNVFLLQRKTVFFVIQ